MKKLLITTLIAILMLSNIFAQYDNELSGYEGDFFSLEGALELFKNSNTIRQFERRLNKQDNWVNNLDLDYDGQTDYVRVEHRRSGNFHAIILQVPLSRYDVQDVAVIEIEKVGRYEAMLQIIGDPDLYGEEVIVESYDNNNNYASNYDRNYINVYNWTPVQYIFAPTYQVYVSPYNWSYRPTWWSPWRQCSWSVFRPRIVTYRRYCRVVNVHRVRNVHNFYRPHRSNSRDVTYRATQVRTKRATSTRKVVNNRHNTTRYNKNNSNRGTAQTRPNTSRPNVATRPSRTKATTASKVSRPNRGNTQTRPNNSRSTSQAKPSRARTSTSTRAQSPKRNTSQARPSNSRSKTSARPSSSRTKTPAKVNKPSRSSSQARPSSSSKNNKSSQARSSSKSSSKSKSTSRGSRN